jgi:hypothetical protein
VAPAEEAEISDFSLFSLQLFRLWSRQQPQKSQKL